MSIKMTSDQTIIKNKVALLTLGQREYNEKHEH